MVVVFGTKTTLAMEYTLFFREPTINWVTPPSAVLLRIYHEFIPHVSAEIKRTLKIILKTRLFRPKTAKGPPEPMKWKIHNTQLKTHPDVAKISPANAFR